ncbi:MULTISPECIES: 7-cyano-7-deazaguanine/7-aminomethyl-7-deazaguanine transporter [unclassified Shewanella]|uniref:7-cyano-7-deazaguanine/7-aminomethyl-7- deazaguanine transporter n=1 Tax=unclassified Shewanella TaxID=196818 RepID=UPI001B4FC4E4|nr:MULTISPECIES: 7-cyano-7-deazaguanine/7-aminomethyl-7-deazaguanine transporter [unclassified Shewanella]MBP6517738.1 7-cyano-7-deazaguanine/7-aminomethyl-7-deazaguanine transporter [Shewanella sp.]MBW3531960.1 7-cyano-7-deazaguanine/7-aminomethyl-7-deazaguanine transporter [Shewanella sp. NKUCC06_TVS]MCU8034941.1 7-cyano-7-deazaguanine/7-aminomethyl-7-deazaguanine transporter [Shewanella sp. SM71]MCU8055620.1 7-cyano-7-deazaguanine/7-aminomethyl-7-deazaguanine transporter [Shewanella sp. SM35
MLMLTTAQLRRALFLLVGFHILIICVSNYLVQLPFQLFGYHTTWGAFSFPFVYLATDLTVRIFGQQAARSIILKAMIPALMISYVMGVMFHQGSFQGTDSLAQWNTFVFRIAFASFAAYLIGQLMDIKVFARIRASRSWWVAPAASTLVGNLVDTLVFFSIAFYASSDSFMAANWPEIATVDYGFKLIVSLGLFLPAYGVLLKVLQDKILRANPQESIS